MISYKDELYHHGIKGQKWGVRRYRNEDGSLTNTGKQRYSEKYSSEQRIRDQKIYGRGAVKRINKRMLAGETIQSARHNEVVRKERTTKAKHMAGIAAKGALAVGGIAATAYLVNKYGNQNSALIGTGMDAAVNVGRDAVNILLGRR